MSFARIARVVRQRLLSLFREERADSALTGELEFHLEQLERENIEAGMNRTEARREARRKLGNLALIEEQCRDERRLFWLRGLKQDLHYALRMMRKSPAFTIVAAVSLAIGIGAHTAIIGAADSMIFGKLPFQDPDRLMMIRTVPPDNPSVNINASLPDFFAMADGTQAFEPLACSLADQKTLGAVSGQRTDTRAAPEKLYGQAWSPEMFATLGVKPLMGRGFVDADYHAGAPSVVLLSYRLWQRSFGGNPNIAGTHIRLNGVSTEVIGVMPADFRFAEEPPDYWVPMRLVRTSLQAGVRYFIVAARLRPGVSVAQGQAELNRVAVQLAKLYVDTHEGWGIRLQPMREALFGWTRRTMLTLEAAVAMLLLIACANLAGLFLARGAVRRHELAMRIALGARRMRIVRQMLVESLLLSLLGGVLGLLLAAPALRALPFINPPPNAPRLEPVSLNLHMALVALLTSAAAGIVLGIGSTMLPWRQNLGAALTESPRSPGVLPSRQQARNFLVMAQIALAFVLLAASGLLWRSVSLLMHRDLHFQPQGLLTFEFRFPTLHFQHMKGDYKGRPVTQVGPAAAEELARILVRLRDLPGTEAVAGISSPPVNALIVPSMTLTAEGAAKDSGEVRYFAVTPHFFETIQSPLLRGHEFSDADTSGAPWTAIVNEAAAHRFWPGQDPLGKRFTLDAGPEPHAREVIGLVRDIPTSSRQLSAEPIVYVSYLQQPALAVLPWANLRTQMTFLARSSHGAGVTDLASAARAAVAEIDPEIPLANVVPMETLTGGWNRDMVSYAGTLGFFAALATFLAAMGVYGAIAMFLAQRTHEIGIRMALGARPWQVLRLVLGRAALLLIAGLGAGAAGAAVLTRLLAAQLWQVAPSDPVAHTGALLLLLLAAALACAGPCHRAMRVNPLLALRGE